VIDSPPPPSAAPAPPAIERPASYQVSYGMIEGRAAPGAKRVLVRVDGRVVRDLRLTSRSFVVDVDLPPREVRIRVETADARGRRAGRTVQHVFGLPRAARPRIRVPRLDPRLQADVRRLVHAFPGTSGVYVEDLASGAAAAWNARATFPAASTLKLAIAVTLMARTVGPPRPGTSLDRMIRSMLVASDNEAANRILVLLGGSTSGGGHVVDGVMRSIGLERTVMYGGYILETSLGPVRATAGRGLPLNVVAQPAWGVGKATTAQDLAQLHRSLWLGSAGLGPLVRSGSSVSAAEARYLLYVLAHVHDHGKLDRVVATRPGVIVLHKGGWIDAARHDAGLVAWRGGIFVAAVTTHRSGGAGAASDVLAGRVATTALRRFSG
jgi:hypothetical protein